MIAAGIISGLLSAVFGLIDFLAIPSGTRAKRVGAIHGYWQRHRSRAVRRELVVPPRQSRAAAMIAIVFAIAGAVLATVTGWLGGELVDRLAVGVDDGAHLDAPSSLGGPVPAGSRRS
jgi:uncharacterized membrane protein